jgi:PAS domain-containing protein
MAVWITTWLVLTRNVIIQKLQISENHARAILDNAVDGIITIDEQGILISLNPAAGQVEQLHRDDYIEKGPRLNGCGR